MDHYPKSSKNFFSFLFPPIWKWVLVFLTFLVYCCISVSLAVRHLRIGSLNPSKRASDNGYPVWNPSSPETSRTKDDAERQNTEIYVE